MDSQPKPIYDPAWKPTYVSVIEYIPPQMTRQAHPIASYQGLQKPLFPSDQEHQQKEGKATVKERIAMAANVKERNIQIWEDCAKVTRDERQEKDADSPPLVLFFLCAQDHVRHEQNNPHQAVLSSISAFLTEELQNAPIDDESKTKSQGKRYHRLLAVRLVHPVHGVPSQCPNARAHREPPNRKFRRQWEPSLGGDEVQRRVSPALWFGVGRECRDDGAQQCINRL